MNNVKIEELIVPLKEYASVGENDTVIDAITALEYAREKLSRRMFKHRAVLIRDNENRIIGKIRSVEIMENIEPKYHLQGLLDKRLDPASDPEKTRSMITRHGLWQESLEEKCRSAARIKVKSIMHPFQQNEYIDMDAPLEQAIHQMLVGRLQSLPGNQGRTGGRGFCV